MAENETRQSRKRVAMITGASSGLGREFARQIDLLQQVDELWLIARNHDALQEIADTLSSPAVPVVADLTSKADIAAIKQRLADFRSPMCATSSMLRALVSLGIGRASRTRPSIP